MKVQSALLVTVVAALAVSCTQETELDRCVRVKTAEYEKMYSDQTSNPENVRDAQRIFCKIAIDGGQKF